MSKLTNFLVVGFYEGTGQAFAYNIRATDPHAAIQLAVNGDYVDMSDSSDVVIVGAIKGRNLQMIAPCDESGAVACAVDLLNGEQEVKATVMTAWGEKHGVI